MSNFIKGKDFPLSGAQLVNGASLDAGNNDVVVTCLGVSLVSNT